MSGPESADRSPFATHETDLNQEPPMLDIHPAHHAASTWRDFFIHIATIVLGLLIAIGLEQSVEALHRLHERHALEAALHTEAEENRQRAISNFDVFDDRIAWLLGLRRDIDTMIATHGKANLPYRATQAIQLRMNMGELLMVTAVWDTMKNNDRLTLLPDNLARSYAMDYHQIEMNAELRSDYTRVLERQSAFESRFADVDNSASPVLSRMSSAQLEEYALLVSATLQAVVQQRLRTVLFFGTNEATSKGLYDVSSQLKEQSAARLAYPLDFKALAARSASAPAK
jgi:hypothetical protein